MNKTLASRDEYLLSLLTISISSETDKNPELLWRKLKDSAVKMHATIMLANILFEIVVDMILCGIFSGYR